MCCHECGVKLEFKKSEYLHREFGLGNVVLKNIDVAGCKCGETVQLPFPGTGMYLAIVHELGTKPASLDLDEFTFIRKALVSFAEESSEFAEHIGFGFQDLIKFNDFGKIDTSSPETIRESVKEYLNTADDALINAEAMKEINRCIAVKLGMRDAAELLRFRGPVMSEFDFKIRELSTRAVESIAAKKYASSSAFKSGVQIIYIEMPAR